MSEQGYDYVIVGAGSAGCVLSNRLGEDLSKSILVIEAGPPDRDLWIHMPAGVYRAWRDPKLNWNYETEAEPELTGRRVFMPRGKVVGGSSSINSMVYMRGHPRDYHARTIDCTIRTIRRLRSRGDSHGRCRLPRLPRHRCAGSRIANRTSGPPARVLDGHGGRHVQRPSAVH